MLVSRLSDQMLEFPSIVTRHIQQDINGFNFIEK